MIITKAVVDNHNNNNNNNNNKLISDKKDLITADRAKQTEKFT